MNYTFSQSYHTLTHWQSGRKSRDSGFRPTEPCVFQALKYGNKVALFPLELSFKNSVFEPGSSFFGTKFDFTTDWKPTLSGIKLYQTRGTANRVANAMIFPEEELIPSAPVKGTTGSTTFLFHELDDSLQLTDNTINVNFSYSYIGPAIIPTIQRGVLVFGTNVSADDYPDWFDDNGFEELTTTHSFSNQDAYSPAPLFWNWQALNDAIKPTPALPSHIMALQGRLTDNAPLYAIFGGQYRELTSGEYVLESSKLQHGTELGVSSNPLSTCFSMYNGVFGTNSATLYHLDLSSVEYSVQSASKIGVFESFTKQANSVLGEVSTYWAPYFQNIYTQGASQTRPSITKLTDKFYCYQFVHLTGFRIIDNFQFYSD